MRKLVLIVVLLTLLVTVATTMAATTTVVVGFEGHNYVACTYEIAGSPYLSGTQTAGNTTYRVLGYCGISPGDFIQFNVIQGVATALSIDNVYGLPSQLDVTINGTETYSITTPGVWNYPGTQDIKTVYLTALGSAVWLHSMSFTIETQPPQDTDVDGILDSVDNCPAISNPLQEDIDLDNIGDACDSLIDIDLDGVADSVDNCPLIANPLQEDADQDKLGDACDNLIDIDLDGVADSVDNCILISNPLQEDTDHDKIGDACDKTALPQAPVVNIDVDSDGVPTDRDNCINEYNPGQEDGWGSAMGDSCDTDWYNRASVEVEGFVQKDGTFHLHGNCVFFADGASSCPVIAEFDPDTFIPAEMPKEITSAEANGWSVWVYYLHSNNGVDVYQVNTYRTSVPQPDSLVDDKLEIHISGGVWQWYQRGGDPLYHGI